MEPRGSSFRPSDYCHQFRDLATLIRLIAARNRMLDAMGDMVLQYLFLDAAQGGTNGGDLRYDIDAVAVLLHHPGETAHLSLNSAQAFLA